MFPKVSPLENLWIILKVEGSATKEKPSSTEQMKRSPPVSNRKTFLHSLASFMPRKIESAIKYKDRHAKYKSMGTHNSFLLLLVVKGLCLKLPSLF